MPKKSLSLLLLAAVLFLSACQKQNEIYVCPPCDLPCDELRFSKAGKCPHCQMPLQKPGAFPADTLILNEINIQNASGEFLMEGGSGRAEKTIRVFYHRPKKFEPTSNILIIVPGAGRNGDSYRDAWVEASEKYGVLILSPMYSEKNYGFGDYHLCGLMTDLALKDNITYVENSNQVLLDEAHFTFTANPNPEKWIFNDFDRLFETVVQALGSEQTTYDIFGHSAGGQILHRLALFYPDSKARRILASNSGFYTLPDFDSELPFGMKNMSLTAENLQASFQKRLVLFNGELDNENEKGGTLLRSPSADKQGLHRLERGHFFYDYAKTKAGDLGFDFNWEMVVIPNVGHEHRKMGAAAAKYLYGKE